MRACGITYTSIMCCSFDISLVAVPILFNDAIIVSLVTKGRRSSSHRKEEGKKVSHVTLKELKSSCPPGTHCPGSAPLPRENTERCSLALESVIKVSFFFFKSIFSYNC